MILSDKVLREEERLIHFLDALVRLLEFLIKPFLIMGRLPELRLLPDPDPDHHDDRRQEEADKYDPEYRLNGHRRHLFQMQLPVWPLPSCRS